MLDEKQAILNINLTCGLRFETYFKRAEIPIPKRPGSAVICR